MRWGMAIIAAAVALSLARPAPAQNRAAAEADADASFGPVLVIERIEVDGNRSTAERLIRRALPVHEGDVLRAGDRRLGEAKYKVLALGYFREVDLSLRKGSARGKVVLSVHVVERGTVVLNLLQFGTSRASPWWLGADLTERNFLGTGIGVGGGLLYAAHGDIVGSSNQWAGELRVADQSIAGSTLGVHAGVLFKRASEPYRIDGSPSQGGVDHFRAFDYRRIGGVAGLGVDVTALARLSTDLRVERIRADVPDAPTRTLPDGQVVAIDLPLRPGTSRLVTVSVGFDRDTRADPVLPFGGDRLVLVGELGHQLFGSDYDYTRVLARYEHWWPVHGRAHVLAVKLLGGMVLGDPPLFEQLYASDFNRMLTPRAFGLVVSTESAPNYLGTAADEVTYGELGGAAAVEYSYRLFRHRSRIYGGDLFVGAGLWGLTRLHRLNARDRGLYRSLPIDLFFDAGLRLDTEIGIFELTLANAFGRVEL